MDFSADFGTAVREHLRLIEDRNAAALDTVAGRLLDVVHAGRLVHTAAAGHGLAAVLETFYRAGGLACVRPLFHPGLLPLHGAQASTQLERIPGLAATLVAQAQVQPGDVGIIFSNSGVNAFPVELADELKKAGAYVVAFSSRPHMDSAPARSFAKLGELADAVLDTAIPPGDAVVPTPSGTTAALSTLCSTYLWNLLLVRLTTLAGDAAVPLWQSSNLPGGDTANEKHLGHYRDRVPML
ncbi:sugar isomerase domain-containing protein [Amycolatopsis kentuckyensis]|uniref:sugar isomerase domain-containing protein n=1 Tax=Amycolatopsis kentuckyensis TaxID=218823 RepID=UPI000A3D0A2F|nr:sugar isomerase domain-containing protein [Amycolatopsis kentuckyensis]